MSKPFRAALSMLSQSHIEVNLDTVKIAFDIESSDYSCPMGVQILLDNTILITAPHLQEKLSFSHDLTNNDGEHTLNIVISGKTPEHTEINDNGHIVKDATITVSNISVDTIDINQLFLEKCVYTHDFNGTQPKIEDSFHGIAGCNGVISFEFTTPMYMWLLVNM